MEHDQTLSEWAVVTIDDTICLVYFEKVKSAQPVG